MDGNVDITFLFVCPRYIDNHIAEELDYQTIAGKFYLSEKSLYQLFKKETGLSPARYINERRIIKA